MGNVTIKPKSKLAQLLCKHNNKSWGQIPTRYHALNTEHVLLICEDCGKILKEEVISNEEYLLRFRFDYDNKDEKNDSNNKRS